MTAEYIDNPSHHAYIIFGAIPDDMQTSERNGLYVMRLDRGLSVDDVRLLSEYAVQSADSVRKVVVSVPAVSFQAQHALLKLLEETRQNARFFIYLPRGSRVLETLLSRCYVIEESAGGRACMSEHGTAFISARPQKRLEMIDTIWNRGESVRHTAILQLIQDVEVYIHGQVTDSPTDQNQHIARCLTAVRSAQNALDNGALHKGTMQLFAFV